MKIIQNDGDLYIKADDMKKEIREHDELIRENNTFSDPEHQKYYSLAHDHIISMIEGDEIFYKSFEGGNDNAGDNNNSDNLCNIGDDNLYQQREAFEKALNELSDGIEVFGKVMRDAIQQISKTE